MRHEFVYMGPHDWNIHRRGPGFGEYVRRNRTIESIGARPDRVEGLWFGLMEESVRQFWVVSVELPPYGTIYVDNPVLIDPPTHSDGKGFGPVATAIEDESAKRLLQDLIAENPDQAEALLKMGHHFGWDIDTPTGRRAVNQEQRAALVWDVLVAHAPSRRTITYSELGRHIGVFHRVLTRPLHLVQEYCLDRYPPLTSIVVTAQDGRPSHGFTAADGDSVDEVQRQVYDFDWRGIPNPFGYARGGETEESLAHRLITDPSSSAAVYRLVAQRGPAQAIFRTTMRQAYGNRCAFCGLTFVEALDAAHIYPWAKSSDAQRLHVSNGLLLCSNHHRLFDAGRLTITENHTITYVPKSNAGSLSEADRTLASSLDGAKLRLPSDRTLWPDPALIRLRNA